MAEGVGFEPTVRFPARQFSRLEPSTARPPFLHQVVPYNHVFYHLSSGV